MNREIEDDGFITHVSMPPLPRQQQQSPLDRIWAESKAAAEREQQAKHAREQDVLSAMQQDAQAGQAKVQELLQQCGVPNGILVTERPETAGPAMHDLKANPGAHTYFPQQTAEELGVETTPLDAILAARGERYGRFADNAVVAQDIKEVMRAGYNWTSDALACDQYEALDQIAAKISRILVGDPDYADNWDDIAGYAKLVADRLRS